jgi:NAD(P)-dependent dehydrogenase (short-subunit alcohol dehydrogenase family)
MASDEQPFFDALAQGIRKNTENVADIIDSRIDEAAHFIRETLSSSPWVPSVIKPPPPPKPTVAVATASRLEQVQGWISRHKILTSVIVLACGVVIYKGYRTHRSARKIRRAKKARNGGRTEVVVIAGSPTLPLTKSLALDMERRGFIVFVVCNAAEDESMVSALSRPDIRPLSIDTTDPPLAGAAIERFALHLQSPQAPAPSIKPNNLTLKSVILIPSLNYQTSPIATIPPSSFADLFNTHLLQPIITIQAFLPLLTSRLQPIGEKWVAPKVLVFTPSIISSINPPFHAPEATVCAALSSFTDVLAAELRPLGIPVTHMQLGTFDFSGFIPARQAASLNAGNPEDTLVWPDGARHVYGRNFMIQTSSAISGGRIRGLKGSSLRHLHNSVFDVLDGSITSNVVRVGLGASIYGFVGRWAPRGLVSWMMGIRKVDQLSTWKTSSYEGSSREESEDGDAAASHEFVAIPSDSNAWHSEGDSNVWAPSPKSP